MRADEVAKIFKELDVNDSGTLEKEEVTELIRRLHQRKMTKSDVAKAFAHMDPNGTGAVHLHSFRDWYFNAREIQRREFRHVVKGTFAELDVDGSGRINKAEFARLMRVVKDTLRLDPPFDLDKDWEMVTDRRGMDNEAVHDITYNNFESWWKERLGIDLPEIPVLPEFMVQRVSESAMRNLKRTNSMRPAGWNNGDSGPRSGRLLWEILKERLVAIVKLQKQWGKLHDLYDAQEESRFETAPVPKWIRDPDSNFSACVLLLSTSALCGVHLLRTATPTHARLT